MAPVSVDNNKEPAPAEAAKALPEWLNKDFFVEIVEREFGKCEIVNLTANSFSQTGENYTSIMHKVSVDVKVEDGKIETLKFITKSAIQDAEKTDQIVGEMAIFPKEIEMYEKNVPRIEELYKNIGIDVTIGARCYKAQLNPQVIVMEDLTASNFENIKRQNGMDLHHAEVTLEKLAKWHAATACIQKKHGDFSAHFNQGTIPVAMEQMFEQIFEAMWPLMKEAIQSWNCESYLPKIEKMHRNMFSLVRDCEAVDPDDFNVLNHGDMWCNNIMFRHNSDGTVDDVKFVDLQMSRWGSPVQDLWYFILSSSCIDMRTSKFDYLIKHYHDHLQRNLQILKYPGKIPSLLQLQIELLKRGMFAYQTCFTVLSIVVLDPSEHATMENFIAESDAATEFKRALLKNPRYAEAMRQMLPFLDNRGLLDLYKSCEKSN